jgi:hypothetical protein
MLSYNGIVIDNTVVREWRQEALRTQDGVGYAGTRVTIVVSGIINDTIRAYREGQNGDPQFPREIESPGKRDLQFAFRADLTTETIRQALLTHQKQLVYYVNCVPVFVSPAAYDVDLQYPFDVDNGPHPISLDIVQVTGVKTWTITYTIQTTIYECFEDNPLMSNRWFQSVDINDEYMATVRTRGLAIFRTDVTGKQGQDFNVLSAPVDYWRDAIMSLFPPVLGYRRGPLRFVTSSDNKSLAYEFSDYETYGNIGDTSLPDVGVAQYVTRVGGKYSTSTAVFQGTPGNGTPVVGAFTCTISVAANKKASIWSVTQYALLLAYNKVSAAIAFGDNSAALVIGGMSVEQNLWEREASVTITGCFTPQNENGWAMAIFNALKVDDIFHYDPKGETEDTGENPRPELPGRGSSLLLLQASLQDAICSKLWYGATPLAFPGFPEQLGDNRDNPQPGNGKGVYLMPDYNGPFPQDGFLPFSDFGGKLAPITVQRNDFTVEVLQGYIAKDSAGNPSQSLVAYRPPTDHMGQQGMPSEYKADARYRKRNGVVVAPVAGKPTDKPQILTLFSPYSEKRVTWVAERLGAIPSVPSPDMNPESADYLTHKLADTEITVMSSEVMGNGLTVSNRVEGEYIYALTDARGAGDDLVIPYPPTLQRGTYGDSTSSTAQVLAGNRVIISGATAQAEEMQPDYFTGIVDAGADIVAYVPPVQTGTGGGSSGA